MRKFVDTLTPNMFEEAEKAQSPEHSDNELSRENLLAMIEGTKDSSGDRVEGMLTLHPYSDNGKPLFGRWAKLDGEWFREPLSESEQQTVDAALAKPKVSHNVEAELALDKDEEDQIVGYVDNDKTKPIYRASADSQYRGPGW